MKRSRMLAACMAAVLALMSMRACALGGGPLYGRVLDQATNAPIAGAIVVVRWHGNWTKVLGESSSACYHVETTRTDVNGRYVIPRWWMTPRLQDLRFSPGATITSVFKPGYVDLSEGTGGTIHMERFVGSNDDYFRKLLNYRQWLCDQPGESGSHLYRVYHAAYLDAKARAVTPAQDDEASLLDEMAQESLTNEAKPTTYRAGIRVNVDPADSFKAEE